MRKSTHTGEYTALREHLASLRSAAGFSQRQLAAKLNVPHSWVAKVESGERRLDLIEFAWFSRACGQDPAQTARDFFQASSSSRNTPTRRGGRR